MCINIIYKCRIRPYHLGLNVLIEERPNTSRAKIDDFRITPQCRSLLYLALRAKYIAMVDIV